MLNPIAVVTNKIVASFEAMFKTIDDGWAEATRRMNGRKSEFEREFFLVDDVPVNQLSHDATVMPVAARKKRQTAREKLVAEYVEMFDEQPNGRWKDQTIRDYIDNAE